MPHPPPFSPSLIAMNISGDLDGYTYYVTRHRKVVAYPAAPALKPASPRQQQMRARFAIAMQAWRDLAPLDRLRYNHACDQLALCMWGANLFTHLSLTDSGALRSTLASQTGTILVSPPPLTVGYLLQPGPWQDAVLAWIARHYPS